MPAKEQSPVKTPKKGQKQGLVIQQITIKQPTRQSVDISYWRQALISAESTTGKRVKLYDLYEDMMLDNVLGDAIDKRIMAITNSNIVFQRDGKAIPEIDDLIGSDDFEKMISEIINSKFWGITVLEFDFSTGFACSTIPRKHINPRRGEILLEQGDDKGIPYHDNPFFLEIGEKNNLGLILKAAPYVIYKRGGFGDWAQFAELFGMPFRKGTYNSYDDYTRKQLEDALEQSGGAPWVVIPKDGNIEYIENNASGAGGNLYNLLKNACNEEILIGILGQTMTTIAGSSRAQSDTHKEVENSINKSDRKFVTRVLNRKFLPIIEARGFPVSGGFFTFPEEAEDLSLKDRIFIDQQLNTIIDISPDYFYETYGIPKPEGQVAKKKPDPPEAGKEKPPEKMTSEEGLLKKLAGFFLTTPTAGPTEICPLCGGVAEPLFTLALNQSLNIASLIEKIARQMHKGDLAPTQTNADLALFTGDTLMEALRKNFDGYEDLEADEEFRIKWINRQQNNIYHFGLAKSYAQIKEMQREIIDDDGNIRPFSEFLEKSITINERYSKGYLETEYTAVVRGTVMVSRWLDIEEQKDISPFLQYVTAGDERVRDDHRALDGIIEPVGSAFWNQYYPPNGWRCRCSVSQLSEREAVHAGYKEGKTNEHSKEAGGLVKDPYWRKNVGKTSIVEADGTNYINAEPGRGSKQLKAVDHYGLDPYASIREKRRLPKLSRITKEQAQSWWEDHSTGGVIERKDVNGLPVKFDEKFKNHIMVSGENHWGVIDDLIRTVSDPDEVWENIKSGRKEKWERAYLHFKDPNPVMLMVDETGRPVTFYELDTESSEAFRRGILIKKK
jgi:SPP1 gp7 family putative phage head morphogenesis protein